MQRVAEEAAAAAAAEASGRRARVLAEAQRALPPEPSAEDPSASCMVAVRLFDGSRASRRFLRSARVSALFQVGKIIGQVERCHVSETVVMWGNVKYHREINEG